MIQSKVRMGDFLKLIKNIYRKLQLTLHSMVKDWEQCIEANSQHLFNKVLEVLAEAIKQQNEIRDRLEKEK